MVAECRHAGPEIGARVYTSPPDANRAAAAGHGTSRLEEGLRMGSLWNRRDSSKRHSSDLVHPPEAQDLKRWKAAVGVNIQLDARLVQLDLRLGLCPGNRRPATGSDLRGCDNRGTLYAAKG